MSAITGSVTLSTPIVTKLRGADGTEIEEQITELVLRRPIARDLLATDNQEGESAKAIALFATLAGVPIETIDGLRAVDFAAVAEKVEALKAVDWPEGTTSTHSLREMFARDLRVTDKHRGDAAKTMALVATLAGVDLSTIQQLPLGEFEALAEATQNPTPPGLPTGETASAN